MPTIKLKNQNGFRVMVLTHDHEPRHVHVYKAEGLIVINLENGAVIRNYMNNRDARKARELVEANVDYLLAQWDEIGPIA